jgi:hypothetical protein
MCISEEHKHIRGIHLKTLPVSADDRNLDFAQPGCGSFNSGNIEVFHACEDSAFRHGCC